MTGFFGIGCISHMQLDVAIFNLHGYACKSRVFILRIEAMN